VRAGSGVATLGLPDSPGVTPGAAGDTLVARYNDLDSVRELFEAAPEEIACVIVEPVAGNMGCVAPREGFLEGLREITAEYGAVLIFDEVMTGFRVARGGAQELYGILPDLTCLGKIIGGGLPVGAFGGRREIMSRVAPVGPIYQAGTLSGNPLAVTAGLTTLRLLGRPMFYEALERTSARLSEMTRGVSASTATPIGTLMKKTQRQVNTSTSTPPSSSPIAPPTPAIAPQTARARLRAGPSAKVVRMIESAAGETIAPPRP